MAFRRGRSMRSGRGRFSRGRGRRRSGGGRRRGSGVGRIRIGYRM